MASIGDLFGSLGFGNMFGGGIISLFIYIILGIFGIGLLGGLFYWLYYKKKKWYLKVEIKIPRGLKWLKPGETLSDKDVNMTGIINAEWGVGTYDPKKGVVYIKRKGKRPVALKPFDIKRGLQGSDILTVIQIGIEDYRVVLPESYIEVIDEQTGEEGALMRAKIDTTESKSWKESYERSAKNAYTIQGLLDKYGQYIGFGILFFMIFVGFAILYGRIT